MGAGWAKLGSSGQQVVSEAGYDCAWMAFLGCWAIVQAAGLWVISLSQLGMGFNNFLG